MTYGRSIFKALEAFHIDTARWHIFAANRAAAWRAMLQTGYAPPEWRAPPTPEPLARSRPMRNSRTATDAALEASLKLERRPLGDLTNRA